MRVFLCAVAMLFLNAASAAGPIKGEVLEIRDVDLYTYLRLRTRDGEIWAAVNKTPLKKGDAVTIENPTVMNNFESKSLKTKFDRIVFGTLAGSALGATPAAGDANRAHPAPALAPQAADVKVPKAQGPGARTVAEIFGKKAELRDKPVLVRGKVVKYTASVMGKNWLHLRDGSGSAKDSTHDILVRTQETTQIGEVVVARGIVRTDVNLGSGYVYTVLVDEATLQK